MYNYLVQEATAILTEEHEGIKRVLALIEKSYEKIEKGEALPPDFLPEILDFIKTFADTCHHGKEEGVLFPLLEKRGIPRDGPIGMMIMEHAMGRSSVRKSTEALERGNTKEALEKLLEYVHLLRDHIVKENNILYPIGNEVLTPEDQDFLEKEFEKIEEEKIGPGKHEAYHQMIEKWEKSL